MEKRRRLQTRIDEFVSQGEKLLVDFTATTPATLSAPVVASEWDGDEDSSGQASSLSSAGSVDPEDSSVYPELQTLSLPSTQSITPLSPPHLRILVDWQLQLEQGQANDALHKLRLAIGHKSFLFREKVRKAENYDKRTRAYDDVRNFQMVISHHADVYSACRQAMIDLGADEEAMKPYQELKKEHLKTDTAVVNPNERGQRNYKLSWIWGLHDPDSQETPEWLDECEYIAK